MPVMRTLILISVVCVLLTMQTGCAETGAGANYVTDNRSVVMDGSPTDVASAAEAALVEMGMAVTLRKTNESEAEVVARTGSDTMVEVVAALRADQTTRVFVRAGGVEDDALKDRVVDKIREHLPVAKTRISATDEAAN